MTRPAAPARDIVLGRGSAVWRRLAENPSIAAHVAMAIGHRDVSSFEFTPSDRVWVFAYSRVPAENSALLAHLQYAGVAEVVYVSSASTIVVNRTRCYEYPRIKLQAEDTALANPCAKILTIGLMYVDTAELPRGRNAGTTYGELAAFMQAPHWPDASGRRMRLFHMVERPFANRVEHMAHRVYGAMLEAAGARACLLRPVDLLLRLLGIRWYGYTYLSNWLWNSKTS